MSPADVDAASSGLLDAGRWLQGAAYRFVTVTPATHARVIARQENAMARSVEDVLGWSLPFNAHVLPQPLFDSLHRAGVLRADERGRWHSALRASTLDGRLYWHSAYPTSAADAVFFGPDTYRFVDAIHRHLERRDTLVRRAVDIGCGAGSGAVTVALACRDAEVHAGDINPRALALTATNAALAEVQGNVRPVASSLLDAVPGRFDLIVANPPYLLDPEERAYRHGGGGLGEGMSLAIAALALERLEPGGTLLLYTGSAIERGRDRLRAAAARLFDGSAASWQYREVDPDVFGDELDEPAYAHVDRIAAVVLTVTLRKA